MGFQKLVIRAGVRHVVLNEDKILPTPPPHLGNPEVSIRVVEAPLTLGLHSFIKFKWRNKSQFYVRLYKDDTYQVFFTLVPNCLCSTDKAWSFIDDRIVIIS